MIIGSGQQSMEFQARIYQVELPLDAIRANQLLKRADEQGGEERCVIHLFLGAAILSLINTPIYLITAVAIATLTVIRCTRVEEKTAAWDRAYQNLTYAKASCLAGLFSIACAIQSLFCLRESLSHLSIEHPIPLPVLITPPFTPATISRDVSSAMPVLPQSALNIEEDPARIPVMDLADTDRVIPADGGALSPDGARAQPLERTWTTALQQWFFDSKHPSKMMKYRNVLDQYIQKFPLFEVHLQALEREQQTAIIRQYTALLHLLRDGEGCIDSRDQYQKFVVQLEALALLLQEYQNSNSPFFNRTVQEGVQKLCQISWTEAALHPYFKEVLALVRASYRDQAGPNYRPAVGPLTVENFARYLMNANKEVKEAPLDLKKEPAALAKQKLAGTVGVKHFILDNTPNLRATQYWQCNGVVRPIAYARHPSPTTAGSIMGTGLGIFERMRGRAAGGVAGEAICASYREMLKAEEAAGYSVFATVLQRNVEDLLENEKARVQLLIRAQQDHPNFHVLVQDLESPFFLKTEGYQRCRTFAQFRQAVIDEFINSSEESRSVLPRIINREEYAPVLGRIFDLVHQLFFQGKEAIEAGDWQNFLLLFYTLQRAELKFRLSESSLPVRVYSTFCKDFLDRGGLIALVESLVNSMVSGQFGDQQWMEDEIANVIGPAIAVKKKEVISRRLQYIEGVYPLLYRLFQDHDALLEFRAQFTELAHGWALVESRVPEAQGQSAMPRG